MITSNTPKLNLYEFILGQRYLILIKPKDFKVWLQLEEIDLVSILGHLYKIVLKLKVFYKLYLTLWTY